MSITNITFEEFMKRLVKYLVEGFVVGVAAFLIPKKKISIEDSLWIGLVGAMTFSILDMFSPSIGVSIRQGAGLGLGAGLVGFP